LEASQKTAAAAGTWSGLGVVSVQAWVDHHNSMPVISHNVLWLLVFVVFIAIPGHLLVFGRGARPFQRDFLSNPEERARQAVVFKQMFVWFISAGFIGTLWSLALMAAFE
jgi:hypothetical protein